MATSGKCSNYKTVRKWENEFSCEFDYDIINGKVFKLICKDCSRWESRIKNEKNFSLKWIRSGSTNVEKDSVKKHVATDQHKAAKKLSLQSSLGAIPYQEHVVNNTPIGRGFKKMHAKDRESLLIKFNTAYYLAKKERPFSDYIDLLKLQVKNNVPGMKNSYKNDRTAATFTDYIGRVMKDTGKRFVKVSLLCMLE